MIKADQNKSGWVNCNNIFKKLEPLCISPELQNYNAEYRMRCETISTMYNDMMHCDK